jgi:hypothetical protein
MAGSPRGEGSFQGWAQDQDAAPSPKTGIKGERWATSPACLQRVHAANALACTHYLQHCLVPCACMCAPTRLALTRAWCPRSDNRTGTNFAARLRSSITLQGLSQLHAWGDNLLYHAVISCAAVLQPDLSCAVNPVLCRAGRCCVLSADASKQTEVGSLGAWAGKGATPGSINPGRNTRLSTGTQPSLAAAAAAAGGNEGEHSAVLGSGYRNEAVLWPTSLFWHI